MIDYSGLSNADLKALQANDLSKVSNEGLKYLQAQESGNPSVHQQETPQQPGFWQNARQGVVNDVEGLGRLLTMPSNAALDFMNRPIKTLEDVGEGLAQGIQNPAAKIANLVGGNLPLYQPSRPDDPATKIGNFLPFMSAYGAGEKMISTAAEKAAPWIVKEGLLPMLSRLGLRTGYAAGVNKALGGSGVSGATANLTAEALPYGLSALGSPVKSMLNRSINKSAQLASKETKAGNILYPEIRSPDQVKNLMNLVGPNFQTSVGEVTNNPSIRGLEKTLSYLPLSGYNKKMSGSISDTNAYAQNVINQLMGNSKLSTINSDLESGVKNSHNTIKEQMNNLYSPIEDYADNSGFTVNSRKNLNNVVKNYLQGQSELNVKNLVRPKPDLTQSELDTIEQNAQHPEGQTVTLRDMRGLESDYKQYARDAGNSGKTDKQKMWNDMAAAIRKDYTDNAKSQNLPSIQKQLESSNNWAKNNYYNVYDKKDIQNILNGKSNNIANVLTKPEHAMLRSQLPQDVKNKLFVSSLGNKLERNPETGKVEINPTTLANYFSKQGAKKSELMNELLTPEMQKNLDSLKAMSQLTAVPKMRMKETPTGKTLLGIGKGASEIGAGLLLHNYISPSAAMLVPALHGLGILASHYLTSPQAIERYIQGKKSVIPGNIVKGLSRASVPSALWGADKN